MNSKLRVSWCYRILKVYQRELTESCNASVTVGYRPVNTLSRHFPKPKDKIPTVRRKEVVYKINCSNCKFSYIGQTERALQTRIKEHQRAIHKLDKNSKIVQHINLHNHIMDFENVKVLDTAHNYHQRLFLEAWHSQRTPSSGNDHIDLPDVYLSLS